jgi:hypothetical protein
MTEAVEIELPSYENHTATNDAGCRHPNPDSIATFRSENYTLHQWSSKYCPSFYFDTINLTSPSNPLITTSQIKSALLTINTSIYKGFIFDRCCNTMLYVATICMCANSKAFVFWPVMIILIAHFINGFFYRSRLHRLMKNACDALDVDGDYTGVVFTLYNDGSDWYQVEVRARPTPEYDTETQPQP